MYIHVHLCAYIAKPKTSYGNKLYNAPFKILKRQNHILHHILNKSTNIDNNIFNIIY